MILSRPQEYILTSLKPINLFLAGIGSGKTYLGGVASYNFIYNFPHVRGFIGANTYQQLTTSTLFRVREVWKDLFDLQNERDYVVGRKPPKSFIQDNHNFDDYTHLISFKNGCVVFKGSLDKAYIHDGKEFAWAILDETKDTKESDVKEVILTRIRQQGIYIDQDKKELTSDETASPFNPLYILTSPAKVAWINDWFELTENIDSIESTIFTEGDFYKNQFKDKCLSISSTYHNQRNLPVNFIQRIIDNNSEEAAKMLIWGYPFSRSGGEFYSGFSRIAHAKKTIFKPNLPLHITFDQNVVPYITCNIWQAERLGKILDLRQIDEICLPNPKNTTEAVCNEFANRYGGRINGLFYYGDASGSRRDTRTKETDYHIVERVLKKYLNNASNRVLKKNPPIIKRRDFINNVFTEKYDIRIIIDEKCSKTLADYVYLKQDLNGKKLKERATDDLTGVSFEKYGHTSDANDYFITTILDKEFQQFLRD